MVRRASDESWPYEQFLAALLEQEAFGREQSGINQRIHQARFPAPKTLEQFDFTAQPSVKRQLILHLASMRFVEARENVIFLRPPGTGKTRLATALALKACQASYHVLFSPAVDMVQ